MCLCICVLCVCLCRLLQLQQPLFLDFGLLASFLQQSWSIISHSLNFPAICGLCNQSRLCAFQSNVLFFDTSCNTSIKSARWTCTCVDKMNHHLFSCFVLTSIDTVMCVHPYIAFYRRRCGHLAAGLHVRSNGCMVNSLVPFPFLYSHFHFLYVQCIN